MARKTYEYDNALDTLNGASTLLSLENEIAAAALIAADPAVLEGVTLDNGVLTIQFDRDLGSQTEIDELTTTIAAHDGSPAPGVCIIMSSKIVEGYVSITQDQTWQSIGGVVTRLSSLVDDMSSALGQLNGSAKVVGAGFEVRVEERLGDDTTPIVIATGAIGDTASAWTTFEFLTSAVPRNGLNLYEVSARLNGATSADLRFCTMSLFKLNF